MVNRGLVIATAKEPFREWLLSLPDPTDVSLEEINEDRTAYLIPEFEDDAQRDRILRKLNNNNLHHINHRLSPLAGMIPGHFSFHNP